MTEPGTDDFWYVANVCLVMILVYLAGVAIAAFL